MHGNFWYMNTDTFVTAEQVKEVVVEQVYAKWYDLCYESWSELVYEAWVTLRKLLKWTSIWSMGNTKETKLLE